MKSKLVFVCIVSFLLFQNISANESVALFETDRIRLAEGFRIGEQLGNRLWKDWGKAPFAVLLVTPETEFLIRHPKPPEDFTLIGYDALLKSKIYFRKRQFNPAFLATFPFGGTWTIVIGQAENTASKTSSRWVVTMLHEHFHQLQYSQSDYFTSVNDLNLSGGDETGMWMLNYAFPYKDEAVQKQFHKLCKLLVETLEAKEKRELKTKLDVYLEERKNFEKMLKSADYRYLSFQLWQEGIARYTEYKTAKWIAENYKPSKAFKSLKDYKPFKEATDKILNGIFEELRTLKFDEYQRVAFYPFGAGEGLLLDKINPKWRENYFTEKFYLEKYFTVTK